MASVAQEAAGGYEDARWKYLDQIRRNAGPYTDPDATAPEFLAQFETFKVL
ncbi:NEDD8 activating enzyme [Fusarium oxysporum]|nr:NEDD8 activating enzyme [Fusarium oxysporum]